MKTIIIGVGNPVLTYDSVGVKVARSICTKMNDQSTIEVSEINVGGLGLMEAMISYERAIIIDAVSTEQGKPGEVYSLTPSDLLFPNDTDLAVAIELGGLLGLQVPSDIKMWAIEVDAAKNVSEGLTENVEKAISVVVDNILADLKVYEKLQITNTK